MLIFLKNIPTSLYNCSVFFSKCENLTTTLTTIILFTHSWWNWERENWSMWRKTSQSKAWPACCVPSPPWWEAISHITAPSLLCIVNKTLYKVHFSTSTDSSPSLLMHLKLCTFIALWMSQNLSLSFAPFLDDLNPKVAHFEGICHDWWTDLGCFPY